MSTVCWYYMQGRCRFGDRCRNLHPPDDYDEEEYVEPSHSRSRKHSTFDFNATLEQCIREEQQTRPYRNESYQRRYADTYDERQTRSYRNDGYQRRYDADTHGERQTRSSYRNEGYQGRYDADTQYSPATNRRGDSNYYSYEPQHGNRFQLHRGNAGRDDTASRVAAQRFDFNKALQDGARTGSRRGSSELSVDEVTVLSDMKSWEEGGQWLFTSYGPFGNSASYPGFHDISMEELRLQFYSAFQAGAVQDHVSQVKTASQNVLQSIHLLLSMPPDVKECLKNLRQGRTTAVPSASFGAGPVGRADQAVPVVRAAPQPQQHLQVAAPAQHGAGAQGGKRARPVYTSLERLTAAERAQFSAEHFTLGEIPTRPPPMELCGLH
ncbi:uncharacterized protein LOC144156023 [Haemaphysalis longicornis]